MSEHKKRENIGDVKLFELPLAELYLGRFAYSSLIFIFGVFAFTGENFSDFSFLIYFPFVIFALYLAASKNPHSVFTKLSVFSLTILLLVTIGGMTPIGSGSYALFYFVFGLPALIASVAFFLISLAFKK